MRYITFSLFLLWGVLLNGQPLNSVRYPQISVHPVFIEEKKILKNETEILAFIEEKFPWLKEEGHALKWVSSKESLLGRHIHFAQYFQNKPVFYNGVRVTLSKSDALVQAVVNLAPITQLSFESEQIEACDGILIIRNKPYPVKRNYYTGHQFEQWETFISAEGDTLFQHDIKKYISRDTSIRVKVFMPNPIQSARTIYGVPFINSNDTDVPMLIAQQKTMPMRGSWENDTFKLISGLVRFGEVSGPKTIPAWSLTDSFMFNRSHDFFEDQNSFYHFQRQMDYLKSIGFSDLLDSFIIDAHAHNGGDNSSFNPFYYPYQFEFGTGGVEDAEDGQVVIHELGHALSKMASDGTSIGKERTSMEEGTCDYFSVSYSRTFNDHQWYKVFSWDGHNEFWEGFFATTKKKYPADITNNENNDREIWSSPLMCIFEKLGKLTTDSLVLAHLYLQAPNATMPEMARAILKVDTLLWGGRHFSEIWTCFAERGILGFGADVSSVPGEFQYDIRNSWGWAAGDGNLSIQHRNNESVEVHLFNQQGQRLESYQDLSGHVLIAPSGFQTGTYYIQIVSEDGDSFFKKLVRF